MSLDLLTSSDMCFHGCLSKIKVISFLTSLIFVLFDEKMNVDKERRRKLSFRDLEHEILRFLSKFTSIINLSYFSKR